MSETTYLVHGPNGIQQQQNPDGSWHHIVKDGQRSVRSVVDENADVEESRLYSPFGELYDSTGTPQTPFGFTEELTDENGLVFVQGRYFNPAIGVFLSPNPSEGTPNNPIPLNSYSYVGGNLK